VKTSIVLWIFVSTALLAKDTFVESKRSLSVKELIDVFESLSERPKLPLKIHYFKEIKWPAMSDKELEEAIKSDMAAIENQFVLTGQKLTESNRLEIIKKLRSSLPFSNHQILECREMVADGKYRRDFTYLDNSGEAGANQFTNLTKSVERVYCSVRDPLLGQPNFFEINKTARTADITFRSDNERFRFAKDGSWRALVVEYDAITPLLLMLTDWSSWSGIRDEFDLPDKLKFDREKVAQILTGNDKTVRIEAYDSVFGGVPALRLSFWAVMPPANPMDQVVQSLNKVVGDKSKMYFTNEVIINRTNYHQWFQVHLYNPSEKLDYLSTREDFDDLNMPRRWTVRQIGPNVPKGQMTVTLHIKDYEFNSKMDLQNVFGFSVSSNYTVWDVDKNTVVQLAPGVSQPLPQETGLRRNQIMVMLFVTLAVVPLILLGRRFHRMN
jgi:hypothetical protein